MGKKTLLSRVPFSSEPLSSSEMICMAQEVNVSGEYKEKNGILKSNVSGVSGLFSNTEKDSLTDKIRQENRERKKRWRQANEDRNKDNDLRCRVNKRAHKLYGKEQSLAKSKWIETEFLKRQMKRKDRERKRSLESHTMLSFNHDSTFLKHNFCDTEFNVAEFSQTFFSNLSQNLIASNHTVLSSLRSALSSLSTNPNFLKIISNLFALLTDNVSSASLETLGLLKNTSLPITDTATHLYQSLLSNLFPTDHELSLFLPSGDPVHDKSSQDTLNLDLSSHSDAHLSSMDFQPSTLTSFSSTSAPPITYKSYDRISAMGFPPMPMDYKGSK
ncbi:hypothetical protein PCANB_000822 [Pneumocystis canis]|nr:hypothetical protein PCK1_000848 [Pneumocystis canis]KAG5437391.1 hypothetical protein PCANB_000822 [Pneumocystis canis]